MYRLLPLLLILFALVGILADSEMEGDEPRHIRYANNICHGFYEENENPVFDSAPGYPIVLAPFIALKTPYMVPKLFNAVLVFIGIWYFYLLLSFFLPTRQALIVAYIMGLYPPLIRWMPTLHSESLAFMLVCGFMFHFGAIIQGHNSRVRHMIWGMLFLGYLLLTKSIFSYVNLVFMGLLLGVFLLRGKKILPYRYMIGTLVGSFLFLAPYMMYTYSKTGKPFFISTGGGSLLYFRSSPYPGELGNWFSVDAVLKERYPQKRKTYFDLGPLSENHLEVFKEIEELNHIQRDSALTAMAVKNMADHPQKYFYNTIANTFRLFFHYPFSYRPQGMETYGYLLPNMFIFVLGFFSLIPAYVQRKNIPIGIWSLLAIGLIYIGGHILLDGRGRYLIPVVPFLVLYLSYIYLKVLKIEFKTSPLPD